MCVSLFFYVPLKKIYKIKIIKKIAIIINQINKN